MKANTTLKIIIICLLLFVGITISCQRSDDMGQQNNKLRVVATTFPLYDFARNIGGDKIKVSLLLPPGSDAHNFEPRPEDIVKISKSDIFLFTNFEMEHWAYRMIKAVSGKSSMLAVESGSGALLIPLSETDEGEKTASKFDPHIWLDFDNARKMVDNIASALIKRDSGNSDYYSRNARNYKLKLSDLDNRYREQLSKCQNKEILHAGHWAFAYLANRYHLRYIAAYNSSADTEPSPQKILSLMERVKAQKISYIFYEDLIAPRLAQTIADETGAGLLKLNNGHDVSKSDLKKDKTFITMMEENLLNLKKGMHCE
jgi:zinc transport system substrate-binding protein